MCERVLRIVYLKDMRYLQLLLCIFFFAEKAYAQLNLTSLDTRLLIESGGITNDGSCVDNNKRFRTVILPKSGCIKIGEGYGIMNCAQYNDSGLFMGMYPLNYSNGYYYWESEFSIRLSFFKKNNADEVIESPENIIQAFNKDITIAFNNPEVDVPYLDCTWRDIIRYVDYKGMQVTSLRLPVMVVFNNGDIFIECEAHGDREEILFRLHAISNDFGKSFSVKKSDISAEEFVYDEKFDRLLGITCNTIYSSLDHGRTWSFYSNNMVKVPEGFESITTCPTIGIQMDNGLIAYPMRAIKWKFNNNIGRTIEKETGFIMFSTDYGKSWCQSPTYPQSLLCDEAIIVPYKKNKIMINARGGTEYIWNPESSGRRVIIGSFKKTKASGTTFRSWKIEKKSDGKIWDCLCNAALIRVKTGKSFHYLFSNPYIPNQFFPRRNLLLRSSKDGKRWLPVGIVTKRGEVVYGYTSLGSDKMGNVYMVYEAKSGIRFSQINSLLDSFLNENGH